MCGIAGILALDGSPIDSGLLARMTRAQAHRGPDDEGQWTQGPVGFGHRRLSIIDLSAAGHQPMTTPDGRLAITYNGEVYNYLELRQELTSLGHQFCSNSDTEVVLKAYEVWGDRCVDRFIGMWAFAIWDRARHRLFCSRDPFGIKPFFYLDTESRFYFASDLRALLLVSREAKEPDWVFLISQLSHRRLSRDEETSFRRIRALRPATNLVIGNGHRRFSTYWSLSPEEQRHKYDLSRPVQTFRDLFIDAVRLHFRSDVPVGVCLSGGLDSSSIVAAAATALDARLKTFTIDYPDSPWSEGAFADEINARYRCEAVRSTPQGAQDYLDTVARMVAAHGEPDQGIGVYSQWKVMELASKYVKVVMDGQGGDELLAGYPYFYETYVGDLIRRFQWRRAYHEFQAYRPYAGHRFGRNVLKRALPGLARILQGVRGRPALEQFLETLQPDLRVSFLRRQDGECVIQEPGFADPLTRHQHRTITADLLQSLLYFEDRNSMAFSIESRVPFLDRRLVEFCMALPPEERLGDGFTKLILRRSLADLLPERVRLRRDKKGFPTPFTAWLRGPLMAQVKALLLDRRVADRRVLNLPVIEQRLAAHFEGTRDHSVDIFNWMTLELWFQRFQDDDFSVARDIRATSGG